MKKRSLFAAVAMLIVSAMVLTSATYAWFNVGGDAYVGKTKGTVMEASSGVRVKTNQSGAKWTDKLLPQNFRWTGGTNPNHFVQTWTATSDGEGGYTYAQASGETTAYAPVSTADGTNFFMYSMNSSNEFIESENAAQVADFYDSYQFYLATVIETADVAGTFTFNGETGNSAAGAGRAIVFISTNGGTSWTPYQENGTTIIFTAGNETAATQAVSTAIPDSTITDDGGANTSNFIMDSTDTGWNSTYFTQVPTSQMKSAASGYSITFDDVPTTNTSNVMVKTVIWIEGQDADCVPNLGGAGLESQWNFTVA